MPSAKQENSNKPTASASKYSLDTLSKLTEHKFASLEERIVLVENLINKHHEIPLILNLLLRIQKEHQVNSLIISH